MLNGFVNTIIDKDITDDLVGILGELSKKEICIGVPDSTNHRDDKVTNAQLMYIHTNGARDKKMINAMQHNIDNNMPYSKAHELYVHEKGSPLWNIPPRPILEPALNNSKDKIADLMSEVMKDALDLKNISPGLQKIGILGQNIARDWFTNPSNKWAKNSEKTIEKKGSSNPLIDKGDLRKSITYVIKENE